MTPSKILAMIVGVGMLCIGYVLVVAEYDRQERIVTREESIDQESRMAAFVISETNPDEKIYVIGNPMVYARAERLSPTKYLYWTWVYKTSVISEDYIDSIARVLTDRQARLLLVSQVYQASLPERIRDAIHTNYFEIASFRLDYYGDVQVMAPL